jgi:hypothetical protein
MNKGHLVYYGSLFLAWVFYAYFAFPSTATKTTQEFGYGPVAGEILALALILTNGLVWFIALYGALRLRSYVQTILKTPDGSAFARIDAGLLILVLSLILPSFLGSVLRATTSIPELVQPLTLATNYSYTILPFIAFGDIYLGARGLTKLVNRAPLSLAQRSLFLIPLVGFAVVYFWLTFTIPNVTAVFQLSDVLIVLTVVFPALLAWVFGIFAAVNLEFYAKEVQGIIYKRSAALLVSGVLFLTIGAMFFLIESSLSPHLSSTGAGELLATVHLFRAIIGFGYIFVAQGAKNLAKLEGDSS